MEPNGKWEDDPLFDEAVRFVIGVRRATAGAIQRHLRIGYSRPLRLIGEMVRIGVLGAADRDGEREVLVLAPPEPTRPSFLPSRSVESVRIWLILAHDLLDSQSAWSSSGSGKPALGG